MNFKYNSGSPDETEKIAEKIARDLKGGEIIAFTGGLGMGKTCFMRGLMRGLDFTGDVTSPTFSIVNEYRGGRLPVFHFDMYRISNFDDLYTTGFFEYLDENGIIAVEWSENIASVLNYDNIIFVDFKLVNDTSRLITIDNERQEKQ